jgi:UDP-N-acetylmuramyl-tripeptide synthetase
MRLARLLKRLNINSAELSHIPDINISSLCCDSRKAKDGSLFVAIDGARQKGSDFVDEAFKRGAVCVVASRASVIRNNSAIPFIRYPDVRYALSVLSDEFFGSPSKKIKVVGITGTNGKTSVAYLIQRMLQEADMTAGIIGTIQHAFKDKIVDSANTTPGPIELQSLLRQMVDAGCSHCVMEVSSHGLHQKRTAAIDFTAAIFTNLTQDHLDYHLNMENYFSAKSILFRSLGEEAYGIINIDDPYAIRLKRICRARIKSYGLHPEAEVRAEEIALDLTGSEFALIADDIKIKMRTALIGRYNVLNILAAAAFSFTQDVELSCIRKAVEGFKGVKGRLQRVAARERNIFVDYAHTPDALENVLQTLRQLSKNKLTVIFGCGGERDSLKRPLMGEIAEQYADTIIITSDNPRSEDPQGIASEITAGIKRKGKGLKVILDRGEAISYGLTRSKSNDTVLIAGKGHEHYQIFKDKTIEFDDFLTAQTYVEEKGL